MVRARIALTLCFLFVLSNAQRAESQLSLRETIQSPRSAWGAVSHRDDENIVIGGRIGPFVAATAPISSKRARVDLYVLRDDLLEPLGSTADLNVVEDVAVVDLDGDGLAEILAVGAGRLALLRWSGRLEVFETVNLSADRSPRVAAASHGGEVWVAVADYEAPDQGDTGRSIVSLYTARDGSLQPLCRLDIHGHIGDLLFADLVSGGTPELLLETGTGEEGGELTVLGLQGGSSETLSRGTADGSSLRVLDLQYSPEAGLGSARSIDGSVRFYRWAGTALRPAGSTMETRPTAAALLLPRRDGTLDLLIAPTDPSHLRRLPVTF